MCNYVVCLVGVEKLDKCEEIVEKLKCYQSKIEDGDSEISLIVQGLLAVCEKEYPNARNILKQGKSILLYWMIKKFNLIIERFLTSEFQIREKNLGVSFEEKVELVWLLDHSHWYLCGTKTLM